MTLPVIPIERPYLPELLPEVQRRIKELLPANATVFEVIASSGHCGTKWLAQVLDAGTDSKWYHELRLEMCGSWVESMGYGLYHKFHKKYWIVLPALIARHYYHMGDSNSWPPFRLPEINQFQFIDRVIYLTRNPILQLHSLATRSYVWRQEHWPPGAILYLEQFHKIGGYERPLSDMTRWEKLCILVAANQFMPAWLYEQGLTVYQTSLEELTTDVNALMALAPKLTEGEARAWQQRDINRKVSGERNPDAIWASWTDEQRQAFSEIVYHCDVRPYERV